MRHIVIEGADVPSSINTQGLVTELATALGTAREDVAISTYQDGQKIVVHVPEGASVANVEQVVKQHTPTKTDAEEAAGREDERLRAMPVILEILAEISQIKAKM
jgi:hypothetical protein